MRTSVLVRVQFPFGHFVIDPHFHPGALVEVLVSSELCIDPGHELHMIGVDGVAVRRMLEHGIGAHLAGRMLVWADELEKSQSMSLDVPKGLVAPALVETVWSVRPTVEAVSMLVASMCAHALRATGDPTARIEEVRVFETERTGSVFLAHQLDEVLAASQSLFASTFPSLFDEGTVESP
jgi:hypothetical protein